ncbi:MAG: class I SAM-dependent methyltransferase, partial [Gammaproteobacteria bacterium]|nr:class I SAM-dependent methyltransferase [Gammaproteobacteria bacterium]
MTIADIDFGRLYREHALAAARVPKPAAAWDARARELQHGGHQSRYAEEFIARMDLAGAATLLDVGCGPGTIGLPLAARLECVYGLDYSRAMLDALRANAAGRGLANVEALHRAWEDDWSDVPVCDIVVASRSTQVQDMAAALEKLDAKARRRVYLTHRVGGRLFDKGAIEALGRTLLPPS